MGISLCVARFDRMRLMAHDLPSDEWDSTRWAGDREFVDALGRHIPVESVRIWELETSYERPTEFGRAAGWVLRHIEPEDNRARLLNMLERMERDPHLWFWVSV